MKFAAVYWMFIVNLWAWVIWENSVASAKSSLAHFIFFDWCLQFFYSAFRPFCLCLGTSDIFTYKQVSFTCWPDCYYSLEVCILRSESEAGCLTSLILLYCAVYGLFACFLNPTRYWFSKNRLFLTSLTPDSNSETESQKRKWH